MSVLRDRKHATQASDGLEAEAAVVTWVCLTRRGIPGPHAGRQNPEPLSLRVCATGAFTAQAGARPGGL